VRDLWPTLYIIYLQILKMLRIILKTAFVTLLPVTESAPFFVNLSEKHF